jgi:hypothetical protein
MAFANAFLGVCHSMAHKLGGTHHVPHGLANALLISHVIRYNATGVCVCIEEAVTLLLQLVCSPDNSAYLCETAQLSGYLIVGSCREQAADLQCMFCLAAYRRALQADLLPAVRCARRAGALRRVRRRPGPGRQDQGGEGGQACGVVGLWFGSQTAQVSSLLA